MDDSRPGTRRPASVQPGRIRGGVGDPRGGVLGAGRRTLRIYSAENGQIIGILDAVHPFHTVNGLTATGGAFDSAGAVIAGGLVFAFSGYSQWGGLPGNVVLAFSVEGR